MEKLNRLGWAAGLSFMAYGVRLGIRVTDPTMMEQLSPHLPPGWTPSSDPLVDGLFSCILGRNQIRQGIRSYNLVYHEASLIARTLDSDDALRRLQSRLQLVVAANSTEKLFVHAGVAGWREHAIVIPGRSCSGKTELVAALLRAGATYYSDEYAVFDNQGLVLPYPRLLSLRGPEGGTHHACHPQELGANAGQAPLPVGLVLVTEYHPGARWQARSLSPGLALLALLDNTVAVRRQPERALTILQKAVMRSEAIKSKRGEAEDVVTWLLKHLEKGRVEQRTDRSLSASG